MLHNILKIDFNKNIKIKIKLFFNFQKLALTKCPKGIMFKTKFKLIKNVFFISLKGNNLYITHTSEKLKEKI